MECLLLISNEDKFFSFDRNVGSAAVLENNDIDANKEKHQ